MAKLREPPFLDEPFDEKRNSWGLTWFEWLRDVRVTINQRPSLSGEGVEDHFPKFDSEDNLIDSGKIVPEGEVVGTTDTQTLTNKTSDYYNLTNDPITGNNAVRKSYLDNRFTNFSNVVSEFFITENLLPEAGTEPPIIVDCTVDISWTLLPDGNDAVLYLRKNGVWTETSRWVYEDY